nr:hypothetical protein [Tanacetum cinerariifolium]
MRKVGNGFSGVETPLFVGMLVEQQVAEEGDTEVHSEDVNAGDTAKGDVTAAHRELKKRVKKLERGSKVKVLKPRKLQKVKTSQRVETFDETLIDDVSNQGRMIAEMDQDADVVLEDDNEVADEAKEVAEDAKEDKTEPAEVQEVVDVVTTAKLITKVVTIASETITAASTNITAVEAQVPAVTTTAPTRVVAALKKAAKRQKLDEEVEVLKRHLHILPNEDDDVYTEATPLAQKALVVDYQIIEMNNKPYYKIIRADDTHQLYVSFLTLLRNFDREDLEALWSLVKEIFSKIKPKNVFNDFLLVTLGAMFEKLDIHAQIWKNQRSVHGLTKVKGWKLLESCGVQIITFTTKQLILLVEKK